VRKVRTTSEEINTPIAIENELPARERTRSKKASPARARRRARLDVALRDLHRLHAAVRAADELEDQIFAVERNRSRLSGRISKSSHHGRRRVRMAAGIPGILSRSRSASN
jgi:hypothetical protein